MACNCGSNSVVQQNESTPGSQFNYSADSTQCLDKVYFSQIGNTIKLVSPSLDCDIVWSMPDIPTVEIPANKNVLTAKLLGTHSAIIKYTNESGNILQRTIKVTIV